MAEASESNMSEAASESSKLVGPYVSFGNIRVTIT